MAAIRQVNCSQVQSVIRPVRRRSSTASSCQDHDEKARAASLHRAWHVGEIRPTFSIEAKPRYLRGLEKLSAQAAVANPTAILQPATAPIPTPTSSNTPEKPQPIYAKRGHARVQALSMVWPIVCRRLEALPNINAMQLFDELCIQFPGRFTRKQYKTLLRRVNLWREDARARGVVIAQKRIDGSATSRGADVLTSSRTIGKRWRRALSSAQTRPHSNCWSSFRRVTRGGTACDSFIRCRSE